MKKNNNLLLIGIIAIVLIGFAYWWFSKREDKKDNIIEVGVIAPLSGEFSRYGDAMKWGIDMAVEDINSSDSLLKIKTIYQDDKFDTKEAINVFKFLTEIEKVPVILGPAGSGISKNLAPFANSSKVVLMSSISTADTLRYAGDYYFRDVSANSEQAKTIANFIAKDKKLNKVGILFENNEYGKNMDNVFKKYFPTLGGKIEFSESYEEKQADFKNLITKIKGSKVDFIFIPGTTWGIAMLVKQLRERGINTPVITGDGGYGEDINKIAGKLANGLFCTLMAVDDTTKTAYTDFKVKYIKKYNKLPDIYSIYSYDATMMIWKAIKNVKSDLTGEAIKNELYKLKYEGLSGKYSFDKDGEVNKPFGLFMFNNNSYIRVK